MSIAINIITAEKTGVLNQITDIIAQKDINITYTYFLVENNDMASITMELDQVEDIDSLINELQEVESVKDVKIEASLDDIYGKRVLIIGGGAQVSQVALGAITEADRHNIRGERISIDTIPLVGEKDLAEAIRAINRLPRLKILILAGSLMGGDITQAIKDIKKEENLPVISLNMAGSVVDVADLVINDPIQAGVLAVMSISSTADFDIERSKKKKFWRKKNNFFLL